MSLLTSGLICNIHEQAEAVNAAGGSCGFTGRRGKRGEVIGIWDKQRKAISQCSQEERKPSG